MTDGDVIFINPDIRPIELVVHILFLLFFLSWTSGMCVSIYLSIWSKPQAFHLTHFLSAKWRNPRLKLKICYFLKDILKGNIIVRGLKYSPYWCEWNGLPPHCLHLHLHIHIHTPLVCLAQVCTLASTLLFLFVLCPFDFLFTFLHNIAFAYVCRYVCLFISNCVCFRRECELKLHLALV